MKEFMYHKRRERNTPVDPNTPSNAKNPLVLRPQSPNNDSFRTLLGILIPVNQDSSEGESSIRQDAAQRTEKGDDSSIHQDTMRRIEEENNLSDEIISKMLMMHNPNPVSKVSSFRSDPFSSFPIKIRERDRVLVNHCLSTLLHLRIAPQKTSC
jgi:hypothetical protein